MFSFRCRCAVFASRTLDARFNHKSFNVLNDVRYDLPTDPFQQ